MPPVVNGYNAQRVCSLFCWWIYDNSIQASQSELMFSFVLGNILSAMYEDWNLLHWNLFVFCILFQSIMPPRKNWLCRITNKHFTRLVPVAKGTHGMWSLAHWGRDKMNAISQPTFSNAFSLMKMFEFWLKFHWSLFLRVQLTIFQHWFR